MEVEHQRFGVGQEAAVVGEAARKAALHRAGRGAAPADVRRPEEHRQHEDQIPQRGERTRRAVALMRRRVEADIDYIRTWSILKDAQIVLLTIPSLLIADNAY